MPQKIFIDKNAVYDDDWMQDISEDTQYGCVFCRAGQERFVAHVLTKRFDCMRAVAVTQIKHKSMDGVKSMKEHVLLPGYVLFKAYDEQLPFYDIRHIHGLIKILQNASGEWRLADRDHRFAQWVFEQGGLIGLSKAYTVGDKVRILSGPLKDFEGSILKIDRRSRNGQVEIRFDEKVWKVWLAFELVDLLTENTAADRWG